MKTPPSVCWPYEPPRREKFIVEDMVAPVFIGISMLLGAIVLFALL